MANDLPRRIILPNGDAYRLAVFNVLNCKDGKALPMPATDATQIVAGQQTTDLKDVVPNCCRFVREDETVNVEGTPWFVLLYVPTKIFGDAT